MIREMYEAAFTTKNTARYMHIFIARNHRTLKAGRFGVNSYITTDRYRAHLIHTFIYKLPITKIKYLTCLILVNVLK